MISTMVAIRPSYWPPLKTTTRPTSTSLQALVVISASPISTVCAAIESQSPRTSAVKKIPGVPVGKRSRWLFVVSCRDCRGDALNSELLVCETGPCSTAKSASEAWSVHEWLWPLSFLRSPSSKVLFHYIAARGLDGDRGTNLLGPSISR